MPSPHQPCFVAQMAQCDLSGWWSMPHSTQTITNIIHILSVHQKKICLLQHSVWTGFAGAHMRRARYSTQKWKFALFEVLWCTEMGKYIHFRVEHCQKHILANNASSKSCSELKFVQKSSRTGGACVYLPQQWSWAAPKIDMFEIL